jgi:hypothetical protein
MPVEVWQNGRRCWLLDEDSLLRRLSDTVLPTMKKNVWCVSAFTSPHLENVEGRLFPDVIIWSDAALLGQFHQSVLDFPMGAVRDCASSCRFGRGNLGLLPFTVYSTASEKWWMAIGDGRKESTTASRASSIEKDESGTMVDLLTVTDGHGRQPL